MNGIVDTGGRALLELELRPSQDTPSTSVTAWIDTGFTGDLVLPQSIVNDLALTMSGTVSAVLADGSNVAMKTFHCLVQWFDELRPLEVVANEGECPLIGVGLLLDRQLRIDYRTNVVTLD